MKELDGIYNANYTIETNTILSGTINGNVIITNSSIFTVAGTVVGELKINDGSRAIIDVNGIINGDIICHGLCEIHGTVVGNLDGKNESILKAETAKIIKP